MRINVRSFGRHLSTADVKLNGFTLVEIMLAVIIVGMLAVLAAPYYLRPMHNARKSSCLRNQHLLYAVGSLYELEVGSLCDLDQKGRLEALYNAGYFNDRNAFRCPENRNTQYADYALIYDGDRKLIGVNCLVMPEEHKFDVAPAGGGDSG